ncbi:MAG: hypothetical protein ACRCU0_05235 [Candidatus Rhabdochlamydia sp.]
MNTIFLMSVIDFVNPPIKFLEGGCFGQTYLFSLFLGAGFSWARVGKEIARYIRDHNFDHFSRSDRAIIRNTHRTYTYLFPAGSTRKYCMEVALPDNLFLALSVETYLRMRSYPVKLPKGNMEEILPIVMRIFLFIFCWAVVRQIIYKALNYIPCDITRIFAVVVAPTGVYEISSDGKTVEFKN